MLFGLYVWFLNYQQHKAAIARLLYVPSGEHKELFESWLRECNVDPAEIQLRYAYTAEQFAMNMGNTIFMDPISCSLCQGDSAAVAVQSVFHQIIEPGLSENVKNRLAAYQQILTPGVQSFFFKHEVAHFVHRYAFKKLMIVFASGFLATYVGINVAKVILWYNPVIAIFLGMFVGGLADLLLAYVCNFLFKYCAEKNADIFAARHCSKQDIVAAAEFFSKLQEINETFKDKGNVLLKLPSVFYGYPEGKVRAAYLLKFAELKRG